MILTFLSPSSPPTSILTTTADTPAKMKQGLQHVVDLPWNTGMLFPGGGPLWMHNTLIPLDAIFVKGGRVIRVDTMRPRDLTHHRVPGADFVVEVNGGWAELNGVRRGAVVRRR